MPVKTARLSAVFSLESKAGAYNYMYTLTENFGRSSFLMEIWTFWTLFTDIKIATLTLNETVLHTCVCKRQEG